MYLQGFEYAEKKLGRSLVSEVLSSNDLPELLKSVGLDMNEFLSDKYPGLAVNPEEAIPVMVSFSLQTHTPGCFTVDHIRQ